jgi:serine/threonine-protein kinase
VTARVPDGPAAGDARPVAPELLNGRYELGELLGRGGMADVRIGIDRRLGRRVAVKQLRSDLSRDPTFHARFRREAQSAASLNHPSIVAVYDTGEEVDPRDPSGGMAPFIVMEHVEGETLRDILRSGRKVLPERALEITKEILSALDYSHHAGIVHRDIKPANVMLTPAGRAKVMDFGIARSITDASVTMTQTAAVVGTAQYLSPEQGRGEQADARSDLYSTGCLLFELLTGRPPFLGDTPLAVAYQHVREEPPAPSKFNPEVTPSMDAVVAKALQKKTSDRYQSAAEMRADVERALAGRHVDAPSGGNNAALMAASTTAVPISPSTTAAGPAQSSSGAASADSRQPPRSRRRWLWALGLVVLVAALAAFWFATDTPATELDAPDLVGQTLPAARLELDRADLEEGEILRRPSDEPADTVLRQTPEAGEPVEPGTAVDLVVSSGPADVQVPYLLGDKRRAAIRELEERDLVADVRYRQSDQPAGEVLRTRPEPTAMVEPGSTVRLVVSAGPLQVPQVVGLFQSAALRRLDRAGFDAQSVQVVEVSDSTEAAGVVIAQTPEPFVEVGPDSSVVLTVSTGPEPTVAPTTEPPPTEEPTEEPTREPTEDPTTEPTEEPTREPTEDPTTEPTEEPTREPTEDPTTEPTQEPTEEPTDGPVR